MITIQAPCKINLGLQVLRLRADGFRDIDTVFYQIPWCDQITITPGAGRERTMTTSDPALPTDERNLCMAAAVALADAWEIDEGFQLHLDKRVPYGAGLGSGSSDAAAVLKALSERWGRDRPGIQEDLHAIAAALGSDVPFFLGPPAARGPASPPGPASAQDPTAAQVPNAAQGPNAARGTGRGEVLTPVTWRCPFPLVVAVPDVHVPTGPAYGMVTPSAKERPDLVEALLSNSPDRWSRDLVNDFQEPVVRTWPAIGQALERLRIDGALYAAMSGSGSAVFGMFRTQGAADTAAASLTAAGCRVWSGS